MISFATQFGHEPTHNEASSPQAGSAVCDPVLSASVVNNRVSHITQEDSDREERIRHHRACRDAAEVEFARHRLSHDLCAAEYHQTQIDRLIQEMA